MRIWLLLIQEPPPHPKFLFAAAAEPCEFKIWLRMMLSRTHSTASISHHPEQAAWNSSPPFAMFDITTLTSLEVAGNSIPKYLLQTAAPRGPLGLTFWGEFFYQGQGRTQGVKGRQSPRVGDCGTFPCLLTAHLGRDRTSFSKGKSGICRHSLLLQQ